MITRKAEAFKTLTYSQLGLKQSTRKAIDQWF
jgi:hypothetical protein